LEVEDSEMCRRMRPSGAIAGRPRRLRVG
jgi:hypothetical protein